MAYVERGGDFDVHRAPVNILCSQGGVGAWIDPEPSVAIGREPHRAVFGDCVAPVYNLSVGYIESENIVVENCRGGLSEHHRIAADER